MGTKNRGFASMDKEKQRQIASKGGRAAHERGTAHEWSREEAIEAGRQGGKKVASNKAHMSAIGRKGGEARARRLRENMARTRAERARVGD